MVTLASILQKVMTQMNAATVDKQASAKVVPKASATADQVEPLSIESKNIQAVSSINSASRARELDPRQTEVYISNTLVCGGIHIGPPAHELNFHLYHSGQDKMAGEVIEKMRAELKDGDSLRVTCNPSEFNRAHQMMVFLSSQTNWSDDSQLVSDLRRGLEKCKESERDPATYFVLVHETRCALLLGAC